MEETLKTDVVLYMKILQDIKIDANVEQTTEVHVFCKESSPDILKILA